MAKEGFEFVRDVARYDTVCGDGRNGAEISLPESPVADRNQPPGDHQYDQGRDQGKPSRYASAIDALVEGGAQPGDIIALTQLFENEIDLAFKSPMDDLDREFKEHLVFVFNQVIQNLRKTGWTQETLESVGKLLFRLYQVFQAYKAEKKTYTLAEWLGKIIDLGNDFGRTFGSA